MYEKVIAYNTFAIRLPCDWEDFTSQIQSGGLEFTFGKLNGVGALQMTVSTYKSGTLPSLNISTLNHMMQEFSTKKELGDAVTTEEIHGNLFGISAVFVSRNDFIRAWYLSNGRDIAFITYICELGLRSVEFDDCDRIVATLSFTAL